MGSSFDIEVDRVDRYGALKTLISRRLGTDKFMLVNENNLPLQHLRDDFLIQGIPDLTAELLGQAAAEPAEQLRLRPARVVSRKPPNSNQRSRMNAKRTLNKKTKRGSTGTYSTPLLRAAPKRSSNGTTSKAAGAPPAAIGSRPRAMSWM